MKVGHGRQWWCWWCLGVLVVRAFDCLSGRYKILHPIQKGVRMSEKNNEIIENHILHLKLHPKDRMYYFIRHINNVTMCLENIRNSTDLIILQTK